MTYECRDPDQTGPDEWERIEGDSPEDAAQQYAENFDTQGCEGYEQERVVLVRHHGSTEPASHFLVTTIVTIYYDATTLTLEESAYRLSGHIQRYRWPTSPGLWFTVEANKNMIVVYYEGTKPSGRDQQDGWPVHYVKTGAPQT